MGRTAPSGWTGHCMKKLKENGTSSSSIPQGASASARFERQLRCGPV